MNHQAKENCNASHDNTDTIAQNTRRKRRVVDDVSSSPTNQASTLDVAPRIPIKGVQPRVAEKQRSNVDNNIFTCFH